MYADLAVTAEMSGLNNLYKPIGIGSELYGVTSAKKPFKSKFL